MWVFWLFCYYEFNGSLPLTLTKNSWKLTKPWKSGRSAKIRPSTPMQCNYASKTGNSKHHDEWIEWPSEYWIFIHTRRRHESIERMLSLFRFQTYRWILPKKNRQFCLHCGGEHMMDQCMNHHNKCECFKSWNSPTSFSKNLNIWSIECYLFLSFLSVIYLLFSSTTDVTNESVINCFN